VLQPQKDATFESGKDAHLISSHLMVDHISSHGGSHHDLTYTLVYMRSQARFRRYIMVDMERLQYPSHL